VSAKQAINDKLLGSVATYFRCGGVVNNQNKKDLLMSLSEKMLKSVNIWQSYKLLVGVEFNAPLDTIKVTSKNVIVSCTYSVFYQCISQVHKVQKTITFLLVTLLNIHQFKKNFTHRLGNKPFLIWLLTQ